MNRRGGGGVSRFSVQKVSVSLPKNFVGEHFGVSGNFGYRKNLCIREGGGISFPRLKLFVTQYRKFSLGNTSVYREFSGIENFYASEGGGGGEGVITCLSRKLFVTQYRKISLGNTSVYREISGIENFYASGREGVSHIAVEKFLSHVIEKFRWGTLRCIGKFRVSKNFLH